MKMWVFLVFACFSCLEAVVHAKNSTCPNGSEIIKRGLTEEEKKLVVQKHNNCRLEIVKGNVPGQPKGVDLKKMIWDDNLAKLCSLVSDTCRDEHIIGQDPRWSRIGQNIFISMNSSDDKGVPNWNTVMHYWFNEHEQYDYGSRYNPKAGHYTQIIWSNTTNVGCDYIYFKDVDSSDMPYTKLYTCNYGPAGNINGIPPYKAG